MDGFRPRFPAESTMARKATDAVIGATKRALTDMAGSHGPIVHPAHTTARCPSD